MREYLPFIATENLLMEAVKRGGDRQELHEVIRKCSMEATARMKEGLDCDLMERLAAEEKFSLSAKEMEELLDPQEYIGRCDTQVSAYLEKLKPLLASVETASAEISV